MLNPQEFLANPIIKGLVVQAQKKTPFGLLVIEALQNEDMEMIGQLAHEYNDFMMTVVESRKDEIIDTVYHRLRGET